MTLPSMGRLFRRLLRLLLGAVILLLALRRPSVQAPPAPGETRAHGISNSRLPFRRGALAGAIALGALLALGGALVAVSGVIPLRASAGHWAITAWLLDFSKRRSIATYTIGREPPADLSDPALIMRGAGHYEIGCRPCHGSPDLPRPLVVQRMLPPPPYLDEAVTRYEPVELFYIVKHGLKFTGMPAWPVATRDDEVWAMVAFLREFARLTPSEYRRLARGGASPEEGEPPLEDLQPGFAPAPVSDNCSRCHGADGRGRGTGAFPAIGGQRPEYLERSLAAFASGARSSGIMATAVAGLDANARREIVGYYAALGGLTGSAPAAERTMPGAQIAARGVPERNVPACMKCHGPGDGPRNPVYPNLGGQHARYLRLQLQLFKSGVRGGTDYQHIMRRVAGQLTDDQIREVAEYYSEIAD